MEMHTFQQAEPPSPDEDIRSYVHTQYPAAKLRDRASAPRTRRVTFQPAEQEPSDPSEEQETVRDERMPPPATQRPTRTTEPQPPRTLDTRPKMIRRITRQTWIYIIVGMLAMTALAICVQALLSWTSAQWDQYQAGQAKIMVYDLPVGHGPGTSHFLTEEWRGQLIVIELPSDTKQPTHAYLVGIVTGDLTPHLVTLDLQDVNHDGKPDLIVQVPGTSIPPTVLFNDGTVFHSTPPAGGK